MRAIITIIFMLALVACGSDNDQQIETSKDQSGVSILDSLRIVEVDPSDVHNFCGAGRACYSREHNRLVIAKIDGENDHEGFQDLGHEVWHAMGNQHE